MRKTNRQFGGINLGVLEKELAESVKAHKNIDYITISGSGEPTLCRQVKDVVSIAKKISGNIPVAVITNSSLLYRKQVRRNLLGADLIIPSLDAASEKVFRQINLPYKSITLDKIIYGIKKLKEEFSGRIWLEIMLV